MFSLKKIGHGNSKATEGWISRWKDRNIIKFKQFYGEKSSVDRNGTEEWSLSKLPEILNQFFPEDIYNANKTGLLYRVT